VGAQDLQILTGPDRVAQAQAEVLIRRAAAVLMALAYAMQAALLVLMPKVSLEMADLIPGVAADLARMDLDLARIITKAEFLVEAAAVRLPAWDPVPLAVTVGPAA
jgi:hypothetical protein